MRHGHVRTRDRAALVVAVCVAGCVPLEPPPGPDLPAGQTCSSPGIDRFDPSAGFDTVIQMRAGPRWCGLGLHLRAGVPFISAIVTGGPAHGQARIRGTPTETIVEYKPNPRFTGQDEFEVFVHPGNGTVRVAVGVYP